MRASREEFRASPVAMRVYWVLVVLAAATLPWAVPVDLRVTAPEAVTGFTLLAVSALNIEIGRYLSSGVTTTPQAKALSAWAFACGLLLATPWLLLVVPLSYLHARLRGTPAPLWKWVSSGAYLVLCGYAAAWVRHLLLGDDVNWMSGDGGEGMVVMLAAAVAFLALESLLFWCGAWFNPAAEGRLREVLSAPGFYLTEAGVLLIGGLLSAVWTGGAWFSLFFVPIYVLVQYGVVLAPMRERAAIAEELTAKNRELAAKNDVLEQSNQFKVDLLSMLGHELGNPLTAVHGYAALGVSAAVRRGETNAVAAFEAITRNSEQMRAVLADILHLVSSERGALVAVPERFVLAPRLAALVRSRTDDGGPTLTCPPDLAAMVQPGHLDQIVHNLLSNAEKYAGGAVAVSAAATDDGHVEIEVVDHGPGVPIDFREQLFARYSRDVGTAEVVMGSGLGLFISRELARANGGELRFREGEPRGSVFVLRLVRA